MFENSGLTEFTGDLRSLAEAESMFKDSKVSRFYALMPKLKHGKGMFVSDKHLGRFVSRTPSLVNGREMFRDTGLTSWVGDLTGLTNGYKMFYNCQLDLESVERLGTMIRDVSEENKTRQQDKDSDFYTTIHLCLGYDVTAVSDDEKQRTFAALNRMKEKGWTVAVYNNGGIYTDGIWTPFDNVEEMLAENYSIVEIANVSENLKNLVSGHEMFASPYNPLYDNEILVKFVGNLSSLEDGSYMFARCSSLRYFHGVRMSRLTEATAMFEGCTNLAQCEGDLSKVTNGTRMFAGCTSFHNMPQDLSSLETATEMFEDCTLHYDSVLSAAERIKDWSGSEEQHTLTVDIIERESLTPDEVLALQQAYSAKGWDIQFS